MKLTNPQMDLLRAVSIGDDHAVPEYRPAQKLVQLGLCEWRTLCRLELTDAGRKALEESK